jgi:hypothetical protein
MNSVTKMFALVLYEGKTNENGIVERKEICSIDVSATMTGEHVTESTLDDTLGVFSAGINQFLSSLYTHKETPPSDVVAAPDPQDDPLRGRAHGLTPHPEGENSTQRQTRHAAEMTRQEGYQHGRNGELPVYTDDTIYMEGYHTGCKDVPK